MGDPKKLKKKYTPSSHPWIRADIERNKVLCQDFGLRTRKEILIASSFLTKYKDIAKRLIANKTAQGEIERTQMREKLQKFGLISATSNLEDILGLELKDILARRLQSLVYRKGLARSMNQARQFIVHRHILVGDKEITSPSCIISVEDEHKIAFKSSSSLAVEDHPERINPLDVQKIMEEKAAIKLKREKDKEEKGDRRGGNRSRGREQKGREMHKPRANPKEASKSKEQEGQRPSAQKGKLSLLEPKKAKEKSA